MQAMIQDCKELFMVPSFSVILLAESIAAVGASGTGYQILYIEVSPSVHTFCSHIQAEIPQLHGEEVQTNNSLISERLY